MLISESVPSTRRASTALTSLLVALSAPVAGTIVAVLSITAPAGDPTASITFGPSAAYMIVELVILAALVSVSSTLAARALTESGSRRLLPIIALAVNALTAILWMAPLAWAFLEYAA
jgi:hypothetical protein